MCLDREEYTLGQQATRMQKQKIKTMLLGHILKLGVIKEREKVLYPSKKSPSFHLQVQKKKPKLVKHDLHIRFTNCRTRKWFKHLAYYEKSLNSINKYTKKHLVYHESQKK